MFGERGHPDTYTYQMHWHGRLFKLSYFVMWGTVSLRAWWMVAQGLQYYYVDSFGQGPDMPRDNGVFNGVLFAAHFLPLVSTCALMITFAWFDTKSARRFSVTLGDKRAKRDHFAEAVGGGDDDDSDVDGGGDDNSNVDSDSEAPTARPVVSTQPQLRVPNGIGAGSIQETTFGIAAPDHGKFALSSCCRVV